MLSNNSSPKKLENLSREELVKNTRRLLAEADALSTRISAVNEIGIAINRTLDFDKIERVIARQAKWLLDFDHFNVCITRDDSWEIRTLFGKEEPQVSNLLETQNVGKTIKTKQPQLIYEGSPSPFLSSYKSQIIIPLIADEICLGTINFAAEKPKSYTQDDMRIGYMLSLQLSSAIRNANIVSELTRTQKELSLRVEELDAYAHTIAHDLKSPLSNILLTGEIIKMKYGEQLQGDGLTRVSSIVSSSKQMNNMIDQLLWLAKLRNPEEAITTVQIKPVVDAAFARFTHLIDERKIQVSIADDLPSVLGHPQWIEEVIANLISNAIKYMGDDNPDPRIDIRGFMEGDKIRLEVKDTGVGIKVEDQKRLFEMFTRLHSVNAEGLGLGLSIIQRIINKLDGEIGVESTVGEGSTFWFKLKQGTT